ncbi:MAG: glycosyltransferase [Akkermansiaceae bacterium]|nr:glycosyltransferase [Verrucomicrobiales bacterium]
MTTLTVIALIFAAVPAGLFLLNLSIYRRLPRGGTAIPRGSETLSVLIPARNEELNIRATLAAVLANRGCEFEVIVLDDHSTDGTVAAVREMAERDSRVRLASAPPLPPCWCGKQHACHVLARLARNPLLVFMDADVRLSPDALARMALFMARSEAALASGVPRQELGTFSERLLLPLIHFVLLSFLPMHAMRRSRRPEMSAGCGQLFIARREAYDKCGGHARLRQSLHDGLKLPRAFREAGFATDLFDATDVATCRMYRTNGETWRGLGKNATEGLAASRTIVPMTLMLLAGQVLPFALLASAGLMSGVGVALAAGACWLALIPRLIAAVRFCQPLGSALLHPLGVLALLSIQWHALLRQWRGQPAEWKGRQYGPIHRMEASKST